MSNIHPGSAPQSIAQAAQHLASGQLVGMPTETVYGLAADACNDAAVASVFTTKGRPANHPLIVHVLDASQVDHFAVQAPEFAVKLMTAFWPGPLTLILPRKPGVAASAAGGQTSIGLRCPAHPVAHALLLACQALGVRGLAAPSANRFGRVSPTTAAHVAHELGDELFILDGGPCQVGIESSIVDCTRGAPVLLRPGVLTREQLAQACGQAVLDQDEATLSGTLGAAPRASGTLESHYAPHAKVRIMSTADLQTAAALTEGATKSIAIYARCAMLKAPKDLNICQMPLDAAACAQELFAVLRQLDALGVDLIWVEELPAGPEWDGVRDRLMRASA